MEEKENTELSFKQRTIKRILPTLFISILVPFILLLSVPFEVFGNNLDEFLFSAKDFLPFCLLLFATLTCVISVTLLFLPNKLYRIGCAIILAGGFMCFLQGTFLNSGYNSLAGDNMGTSAVSIFSKILNLFIWLIVIAGAIVLACLKDKNGIINLVAIVIGLVILFTHLMPPVVIAISNKEVFTNKEDRPALNQETTSFLTNDQLTTFSSESNILFICIDRFDQKYADQAYLECPEIFSQLDGFTAFDDNIAKYGHTYPAISHLLTSKTNNLDNSRGKHFKTVYSDNKTLNVLEKNGYSFGIYMPTYYGYENAYFLPDNVVNRSTSLNYAVNNKVKLPLKMVQTAVYRCLPILLKPYAGNVNSSTANALITVSTNEGAPLFDTDTRNVWYNVKDKNFDTKGDKKFTYIHLNGCHDTLYDKNWNNTSLSNPGSIITSLKNSFDIVNKYIKELKDKGLYDSATIIITGDHSAPHDDSTYVQQPRLTALFFKPSGVSTGELKHSSAQVSHDNIWSTILTSVGITPDASLGKSLFDIGENETTVREFVWYTYNKDTDQYTYKIEGKGSDFANWTEIEHKYYPKFLMD